MSAAGFRVGLPLKVGTPITIDLRGHRLRGPGSGDAFNSYDSDVLFKTVTLKNGRIERWGTGFFAVLTSLRVDKVQFHDNKVGLYCGGGNCEVAGSVFRNNAIGTTMNEAVFRFRSNLFVNNELASRASGPNFVSSYYTNNAFTNNKVGVSIAGSGGETQLLENIFTRNGVGVRGGPYSQFGNRGFRAALDQNLFVANGDGVILQLDLNEDETAALAGNIAIKNKRYGFNVPGATDLGGNKAAGDGQPCVGVVCGKL